jgi:alginate O-acetyltransferase complex protein AlgI
MGQFADGVFSMELNNLSSGTAWMGILAYTFQIYFDFSGYSDMAIGIGKMIGFVFPENFNNPYISSSITEFWRRWHISLGNWMRSYLYIPLGGNRVKTKSRLYFNLWFVFLASGLWHGASWSFVLWGAYHGLFLVLERIFLLRVYEKIGRIPAMLVTFFIVVIGWVFFRIENLDDALMFLKQMFSFSQGITTSPDGEFIMFLVLAVFFAFFAAIPAGNRIQGTVYFDAYPLRRYYIMGILTFIMLMICISSITAFGFNPFIYFRF